MHPFKQMHYNMFQYHSQKYTHTVPLPLVRHIVSVWPGKNDSPIHNYLEIAEYPPIKKLAQSLNPLEEYPNNPYLPHKYLYSYFHN